MLVAEDNLVNQEVARAMLRDLGCEIRLADNGREALNALRSHAFDIVFMDCQMPEMDGFEAVRRFRTGGAGRFSKRARYANRCFDSECAGGRSGALPRRGI